MDHKKKKEKKKKEVAFAFPQLRVSRRFRARLYCAEVIKRNKRRDDNTAKVHGIIERRKERSGERERGRELGKRIPSKRGGGEEGERRRRKQRNGERVREDLDSRLIAV